MTAKHQSPQWRRTCKIIRTQVRQAHERGVDVECWRCGHLIEPGQKYDVGHLNPNGGEGLDNAAPEHRHENRSHGGRLGARITNARHRTNTTGMVKPAWA